MQNLILIHYSYLIIYSSFILIGSLRINLPFIHLLYQAVLVFSLLFLLFVQYEKIIEPLCNIISICTFIFIY